MNGSTIVFISILFLASNLFAAGSISLSTISTMPTKIAAYSYQTTLKNGTALATDTVLNNIKNGLMMDCDISTCDYKVQVTAKQAQTFDTGTLKGLYDGQGVSVKKIFYWDTHVVQYTRPTYKIVLLNYTAVNKSTGKNGTVVFYNSSVESGSEKYNVNESFENTAITTPFAKDEVRTYVIRFAKDNPRRNVDIYHSIYGQDRKDAAWWNSTWQNKVQINLTSWTCSAAYCQFPITFTTAYGNGSDWRFLDSTESTTFPYWYEDLNFSAGLGRTWVNASNGSTMIYLYYNATGAPGNQSWTDNVFVFGDDFNGASVNTSKWTTASSASETGGELVVVGHNDSGFVTMVPSTTNTRSTLRIRPTANDLYMDWGTHNQNVHQLSYRSSNNILTTISPTQYTLTGGWANGNSYIEVFDIPSNTSVLRTSRHYNTTGLLTDPTYLPNGTDAYTSTSYNIVQYTSGTGYLAYFVQSVYSSSEPSFAFGSPQPQTAPAVNITCYAQTATNTYNGTAITYTITGIFTNPTAASENINLSITANGTTLATLNNTALAAGATTTLVGSWLASRPTTDKNFTINASATGYDINVLSGTSSIALTMLLPIDPPSAYATKFPIYSPIGNSVSWVWGQVMPGDVIPVWADSWSSYTWTAVNRGDGKLVLNGSAQNWTKVAE